MSHLTEEQVQEYLDRTLDHQSMANAQIHLQSCHICRNRVRSCQTLYQDLRQPPEWQFSQQFEANLMRRINQQPLGAIHHQLWTALLVFGIFIVGLSLTIAYTDTKTYVDILRNVSLPDFKFNWDVAKLFNFMPTLSPIFKSLKINSSFIILCGAIIFFVGIADHFVQFAKSKIHHPVR